MEISFSERLKLLRTKNKLTQTELATKSGVSRKQISDFEMEIQKNPRSTTIYRLAEALNVSPSYLLHGVEDKAIEEEITNDQSSPRASNLYIPSTLRQKIEDAATKSGRSVNAEAVHRLNESFQPSIVNINHQADVKIIPLKNGQKRVIYGKLLNTLDLDYTQPLSDLRIDIQLSLETLSRSSFWKALKFFNKEVIVYKGDNHIDVVDNGEGSLGWLRVEDHYVKTPDISDRESGFTDLPFSLAALVCASVAWGLGILANHVAMSDKALSYAPGMTGILLWVVAIIFIIFATQIKKTKNDT